MLRLILPISPFTLDGKVIEGEVVADQRKMMREPMHLSAGL